MSFNIDYSAMLAETIGEAGVDRNEFEALRYIFRTTRADLAMRHATGHLPFYDLPFDNEMIASIENYSTEARGRFKNFVLMGIGGSALGPIALHGSLNHPQHNLLPNEQRPGMRFFCPDNVDPDYIGSVFDVAEPRETLFNVVSKSGGTAETVAQLLMVVDVLRKLRGRGWQEHLVITTDPEKGLLREFARSEGIRTFPIPPGVGGRFCVLTPVGLLPAAMTGINIWALCAGAKALKESVLSTELESNPAALFAGLLYLMQSVKARPIHVMFAYSNRLYPIADWFRQMWAESLGKRYSTDGREIFTGPTPIKALGATDQHSQVQLYVEGPPDKAFVMLGTRRFGRDYVLPDVGLDPAESGYLHGAGLGSLLNAERRATTYALAMAGRPVMSIEMDSIDPQHIGALLYLFEAATLFGGGFYRVNPLDQPGVEAGKKATYALMGRKGYESQQVEMVKFYEKTGKSSLMVRV